MNKDLDRFINAQKKMFPVALEEIKTGKKQSHWMWYIFPQVSGLGSSPMSVQYGIKHLQEAEAFLRDPVLGARLIEISKVLVELPVKNALHIFGSPDDMKLRSSMTLFRAVKNSDPVFKQVIDQFFGGNEDEKTLRIISEKK